MKYISIGIHVDSLINWNGYPADYHDPIYFQAMDRFLEIAERRNVVYTIYVIGKDLESDPLANQVKMWMARGHEIASHSWSHYVDLSLLSKEQTFDEIEKAHNIIGDVTGVAPVGFVGPGWAQSKAITDSLLKLKYRYDTSLMPSWLMYPLYFFWVKEYVGHQHFQQYFRRGMDIHQSVFRSNKPRFLRDENHAQKLLLMPTPVTKIRLACWHSLGYLLGQNNFHNILTGALNNSPLFHYIMHAADLLAPEDLKSTDRALDYPRVEVQIEKKIKLFEGVLDLFEDQQRAFVTTIDQAEEYISIHNGRT